MKASLQKHIPTAKNMFIVWDIVRRSCRVTTWRAGGERTGQGEVELQNV